MQRLLERVAFISVGADVLIAGSTYLVIRNAPYSNSFLMASDYIDFALVALAVSLFATVLALKFSLDIGKKARMFMFRLAHRSGR